MSKNKLALLAGASIVTALWFGQLILLGVAGAILVYIEVSED